jgi:two-component system, NarL family, nitrate/nitrite response regulator NarL
VGQSQSTSTVIIGQRALVREGVIALLQQSCYKAIASAERASELQNVRISDGRRALAILVIDDTNGNLADAAESIRVLRARFANIRTVVVVEIRGPVDMQAILTLDSDGYVANISSREILLKSLDLALLDQQVIVLSRPRSSLAVSADQKGSANRVSPSIVPATRDFQNSSGRVISTNDPKFSRREREVLNHLAEGDSNKEIARLCNITESTVKVHLKAILRKITVHNRTQAAIWAVANGYHPILVSSEDTIKQTSPGPIASASGNGKQILQVGGTTK